LENGITLSDLYKDDLMREIGRAPNDQVFCRWILTACLNSIINTGNRTILQSQKRCYENLLLMVFLVSAFSLKAQFRLAAQAGMFKYGSCVWKIDR